MINNNKLSGFHKLLTDNVLTNKIFKYPILANDGYVYELYPFIKHVLEHKTSPKTGHAIQLNFMKIVQLEQIIDIFIEHDPYLINNQYLDFSLFKTIL